MGTACSMQVLGEGVGPWERERGGGYSQKDDGGLHRSGRRKERFLNARCGS